MKSREEQIKEVSNKLAKDLGDDLKAAKRFLFFLEAFHEASKPSNRIDFKFTPINDNTE